MLTPDLDKAEVVKCGTEPPIIYIYIIIYLLAKFFLPVSAVSQVVSACILALSLNLITDTFPLLELSSCSQSYFPHHSLSILGH